ncbi:hypothetical protein ACHAW5_007186 [Stephanodiscus triporus]|uniref:Dynein regulatory complex subunit 2 n=1 Tax=Stephanodiscus triporus TaxID=2934178 RepID=A0ABD3MF64_9STRA
MRRKIFYSYLYIYTHSKIIHTIIPNGANGTPSSNIDDVPDTPDDPIGNTAPPFDVSSSANVDQVTNDDIQNKLLPTTDSNRITERLDRELALSKTHRLQLQSHWRQVLVREKFQELHNEIPQLIQCHDENVARKEEVIDSLLKEIRCLQELYRDATIAKMNRIEGLVAIHNGQVMKLEGDFRDRVSSFQSQFRKDIDMINSQYGKEKDATRRCVQAQAEVDARQINALQQKYYHELEEIKNRNNDVINGMRFIMDSKLEELEEQFVRSHGEFAQNTDGTRIAYGQLNSKNDAIRKEISDKMRHANKLQREIQRFQLIAKQEEAQISERHHELLARKTRAIAKWNSMQERMTMFREEQQTKLLDLIRRANERKEALIHQCELAERVEKIALACQKLESSREKFASLLREAACPMDKLLSSEDDGGESTAENDKNSDQRALIVGCMGRLGDTTHNFWNKYNMAKLDILILERDVRRLKIREEELRTKLNMYRDGITVNDDVMKDRNPLFVINGKMNAMLPKKKTEKSRRLK